VIGTFGRTAGTEPDETRRYLTDSSVEIGPRDRLQIAGILRPDVVADLEPDASVAVLLPHDATLVLERADPDVVLFQSSALAPGQPWAYGGEPSAGDVARRLLGVLETATALGRRVVLWFDGPRHAVPALIPFEWHVDLVVAEETGADTGADLAWTTGVQLARFDPIASPAEQSPAPVSHRRWHPGGHRRTETFIAAALTDLVDDGLEIWVDGDDVDGTRWIPERLLGNVRSLRDLAPSHRLPALYRSRGIFLAEPITARPTHRAVTTPILRQLASGCRVVSGPHDALREAFDDRIEWATDAQDVRRAVATAVERGPRSLSEMRSIVRDLFREHDTSSAVERLASLTGSGRRTPVREVCVVVRLDGTVRAEDFVDALTIQGQRPTEALIAGGDPSDVQRAVNELEWVGITTRTDPDPPDESGLLRWAADRATAGWLWAWSPRHDHPATFLLDMLAAGAMTRAAAVGRASVPSDRYVQDLAVTDAIVDRVSARTLPDPMGGSLVGWSARGAALFGLAAMPGDQ
jgi:hypothetical protein